MNVRAKKSTWFLLAITSLVGSRLVFAFVNDPEGPNLLIVVALAAVLYLLALGVSSLLANTTHTKKLLLAVATQVCAVALLGFFLR